MKNLFLLPTEKPSRLGYLTKKGKEVFNDLILFEKPMPNILDSENQNIYITSDEEIKDCCVLNTHTNEVYFLKRFYGIQPITKKIILTTDQELINDGIQKIDDEFLEWFVKNPSCESVKYYTIDNSTTLKTLIKYQIIIPKEELKQETLEEASKDYIENTMKFSFNSLDTKTQANRMLKCAEFGAKWQQERMYSEEEVIKIVEKSRETGLTAEYLLLTEQFKKK